LKAIHQLINYFSAKGRISSSQLEELGKLGFWQRYSKHDIRQLANKINESFYIEATGSTHGAVWGTDVYTSDSDLDCVCVHAGILAPGETGLVKVTMLSPPGSYSGSNRNGVTTMDFGRYHGAYKVEST
jgi:hypothetical protein